MLAPFVIDFTSHHIISIIIISMCSTRYSLKPTYNLLELKTVGLDLLFSFQDMYVATCAFQQSFSHHPPDPSSLACDSVSNMGFKFPKEVLPSCFPSCLID